MKSIFTLRLACHVSGLIMGALGLLLFIQVMDGSISSWLIPALLPAIYVHGIVWGYYWRGARPIDMVLRKSQSGSAILILFICVALFGALSYAVLQGSRTSVGLIESEQDKAATTASADCANATALAVKRLEVRGCANLVSYASDGTNFISGAPQDGSCSVFHPNGGGVNACDSSMSCDLGSLAVGERCGGVIYAATYSGNRLYIAEEDSGVTSWNNGTAGLGGPSGLTPDMDGIVMTDILVAAADAAAPYKAAHLCRNRGPDWYLPPRLEWAAIKLNRAVLDASNAKLTGRYWTASPITTTRAGTTVWEGATASQDKHLPYNVRCARRD